MWINSNPLVSLSGVLLCILLLTGCGDGLIKTTGTVSVDGQPVSGGKVVFFPIDGGRQGTGRIKPDGTYVVSYKRVGDGLPPGDYTVTIVSDKLDETKKAPSTRVFIGPNGEEMEDDGFMPVATGGRRARKDNRLIHIVPTEYNQRETSPLEVTIPDAAPEPVDFDLPSKK